MHEANSSQNGRTTSRRQSLSSSSSSLVGVGVIKARVVCRSTFLCPMIPLVGGASSVCDVIAPSSAFCLRPESFFQASFPANKEQFPRVVPPPLHYCSPAMSPLLRRGLTIQLSMA